MAARRPKRAIEAPSEVTEGADHHLEWISPVKLKCRDCTEHTIILMVPETRTKIIKELVRRRWLTETKT